MTNLKTTAICSLTDTSRDSLTSREKGAFPSSLIMNCVVSSAHAFAILLLVTAILHTTLLLVTTHKTSKYEIQRGNLKGESTCSWRAARALLRFLEVSASSSCRARATASNFRLTSSSSATDCSHSSSSSESIGGRRQRSGAEQDRRRQAGRPEQVHLKKSKLKITTDQRQHYAWI